MLKEDLIHQKELYEIHLTKTLFNEYKNRHKFIKIDLLDKESLRKSKQGIDEIELLRDLSVLGMGLNLMMIDFYLQ